MSIYATSFHLEDRSHELEPGVTTYFLEPGETEEQARINHEKEIADDPGAPFVYKGSHILPSEDDERGGGLEIAWIPNHITREDRTEGLHDWIRLGVWAKQEEGGAQNSGSDTVLLDRAQVTALRDELTAWLERSGEPEPDLTPEQLETIKQAFDR